MNKALRLPIHTFKTEHLLKADRERRIGHPKGCTIYEGHLSLAKETKLLCRLRENGAGVDGIKSFARVDGFVSLEKDGAGSLEEVINESLVACLIRLRANCADTINKSVEIVGAKISSRRNDDSPGDLIAVE